VICALLLVVAQGSSVVSNIYSGLVWFVVPAVTVIANDITAYYNLAVFGRARGYNEESSSALIGTAFAFFPSLMPAISSVVAGLYVADKLSDLPYFTCPQPEILLTPFSLLQCEQVSTFTRQSVSIPELLRVGGLETVFFAPFHGHALVISLVASVLTHFGAVFYHVFKRAIVPLREEREQGPVDRVNCHILMVMFTYVYLKTFVHRPSVVDGIIAQMHELTDDDQLKVLSALHETLKSQGMLPRIGS
jgi:phosphatidate cytidylyltransferase